MTQLPMKAKVMIGMVALASLVALTYGVQQWQTQSWSQLAMLAVAAALSSRFKVKIPGTTSSMSGNLPIVLIAVMQLGLFGSLIVAFVAAIAQSYTPHKGKTKPLHFLFNACTLLNASGLAYVAYHGGWVAAKNAMHGLPLVLAAATYFLANTAPVAGIIGLTEGGNPLAVWHQLFLWSFPNYVIGAGLAAIVSVFATVTGVITVGTLLAVLYSVHTSYKLYVGRAPEKNAGLAPRVLTKAAAASR